MNTSDNLETTETATAYQSQLAAARAVNNAWKFEGRELEKFVARGEAHLAQSILHPVSEKEVAKLIHLLKWEKDTAFLKRVKSQKTNLESIGRQTSQRVQAADEIGANVELYKEFVQSGVLLKSNSSGEIIETSLNRQEMLDRVRRSTNAVSEVIEGWFEAGRTEIYFADESEAVDFFINPPDEVKVLWWIGDRENPAAAAVFTFKTPNADVQTEYRENGAYVNRSNRGDVKVTEITQNLTLRLRLSAQHLISVEGVAVETEGTDFTQENKSRFVMLFNPIWFADAVDALFEVFGKTKGKFKAS